MRKFVLLGLMLATSKSRAQALQDPTRPPAQLQRSAPDAAPASTAPRVQSILIARQPGGRHVAVIDGETVRLGGTFRGARVVRMTQNEVELLRGSARQVLKLSQPEAVTAPPAAGKPE